MTRRIWEQTVGRPRASAVRKLGCASAWTSEHGSSCISGTWIATQDGSFFPGCSISTDTMQDRFEHQVVGQLILCALLNGSEARKILAELVVPYAMSGLRCFLPSMPTYWISMFSDSGGFSKVSSMYRQGLGRGKRSRLHLQSEAGSGWALTCS